MGGYRSESGFLENFGLVRDIRACRTSERPTPAGGCGEIR